jgi:hypothetical protein
VPHDGTRMGRGATDLRDIPNAIDGVVNRFAVFIRMGRTGRPMVDKWATGSGRG